MHFPVFVPPLLAATMCVVCAMAGGNYPQKFFQEWQPVTLYNALQLFLCASVAGAIAKTVAARRAPAMASTLLWSIVCAFCVYIGCDELFQFHESSAPIAQALREFLGQPGDRPFIAGFELPSYSLLIESVYAGFAIAVALVFRRDLILQPTALCMLSLSVLFLGGSQFVDITLLQGPNSILVGEIVLSDGTLSAISQSLKVAGFATVLAALLETLLAKKQILSVERMLSELSAERPAAHSRPLESVV